ncbi:MAG TPA: hypothetical protein VKA84_14145 [Gemmatimonadaceae bacterium]|nr:hypothetical protein [Gemmatimonadaceae bacterium]
MSAGPAAEQRFRTRRVEFAGALRQLLGARAAPEPLADRASAAALAAELAATLEAAEQHDWGVVSREWSAADAEAMAEVMHRLSGNLGARAVWLLTADPEPQGAPLGSDAALDNPLGFAAAGGHELRLLDRELPAGLWLVRHSHHYGPSTIRYRWALEVWGEPWLSAATRALRGVGP